MRDTRIYLFISPDVTSKLFAGSWTICSGQAADDVLLGAPLPIVELPSEDDGLLGADQGLLRTKCQIADLCPS